MFTCVFTQFSRKFSSNFLKQNLNEIWVTFEWKPRQKRKFWDPSVPHHVDILPVSSSGRAVLFLGLHWNVTCHTQCMDLWAPAQHQWKWTSPSTMQETTFVFKAHSMLLGCQTISTTRLAPKFSLRPWALGVALRVAYGDSLRNAAVATTLTPHSSVSKWKVSHWNPGDKPNHSKNWRPSDWKPAEQQEHTAHCFGVAHLMPLPMLNWTKSESSLRIQVRPNSWITSQGEARISQSKPKTWTPEQCTLAPMQAEWKKWHTLKSGNFHLALLGETILCKLRGRTGVPLVSNKSGPNTSNSTQTKHHFDIDSAQKNLFVKAPNGKSLMQVVHWSLHRCSLSNGA